MFSGLFINFDWYYNFLQKRQVFYKGTKAELLELRHDSLSRPILFDPKTGEFEAVRQDYDRFGHLSRWRWGGDLEEAYEYDKSGRLSAVSSSNVTLFRFAFCFCTLRRRFWIL